MPIWTGAGANNNWNTAANWDTGVPTATTDAIFDGTTGANPNKNCTITAGAVCRNLNFTGYTGTVTFSNTLEVRATSGGAGTGSITFGAGMGVGGASGINHAVRNGITSTITSNGFVFGLPYNVSNENGATISLPDNFQITNYTSSVTPSFTGAGKLLISGNCSGSFTGTGTKEFNGTGTIGSVGATTLRNNIIFNTSGTLTIGTTLVFSGNVTFTAGTIALTNNFVHEATTTDVIIFNSGILFSGSGNLVLRNVTATNAIRTITSNGVSWPNSFEINPVSNNTNTLTVSGNFTVLGNASFLVGASANNTQTINGDQLIVRGNFSVTTTGGIIGTSSIVLDGSGNADLSSSGQIQNNLNINKSGGATVSILSSFTWGAAGRTLSRTAGNINPGTSTITIANAAVTIDNMVFNNLTYTGGASSTITHNVANTINSTLTCNATTTFTGTAGWTAATFSSVVTSAQTITFQAGIEYRVTSALVAQGSSISTLQLTFQSSSASVRAIFTLDNGATQSVYFVRAIRIDSGLGQTIWDVPGTISPLLTDTINWNPGTRPAPIAYSFIG